MNHNKLKYTISIFLFIAAFIFIFIVYQINPLGLSGQASTDYQSYYYIVAQNLVNGKGLSIHGKPAVQTPPGYPMYLASLIRLTDVTKINYNVILVFFNFILYSVIVFLVYKVSVLLWPSFRSLPAVVLWSSYPLYLFCALIFSSELLFTCFLVFSVMLTLILFKQREPNTRIYYVLAIVLSILVLIRPIAVLFVIFDLIYVLRFCRKIGMKVKVLFVSLAIFPIILWSIWASVKTNRIVFLSTAGLTSIYDGLTFAVDLKNYREPKPLSSDIKAIMIAYRDGKSSESFSNLFKLTIHNIKNRPSGFLKLMLWKIARSWYGTDSHRNENIILLIQLIYLLPGIAGLIRSINLLHSYIVIFLCGSIIAFWMMTILVLSIVRYMTPVSFVLFLFIPAIFKFQQRNNNSLYSHDE